MPEHHDVPGLLLPLALAAALLLAAGLYLAAATRPPAGRNPWPAHRSLLWLLGLATIAAAGLGPLADAAHQGVPAGKGFPAHMAAHLLAGMLAPLLIALSAPATLALRTLDVARARRLSRLLTSRPFDS
jgi:putative membrane protein